jgi:hypothetical protein
MVAWQVSRRLYAVKTPNDAGLVEPISGTDHRTQPPTPGRRA